MDEVSRVGVAYANQPNWCIVSKELRICGETILDGDCLGESNPLPVLGDLEGNFVVDADRF